MKFNGFKLCLIFILSFILIVPIGLACRSGNGGQVEEEPNGSGTVDNPFDYHRTYTTNDDFDEGTLVGLEHETIPDQLQLSKEQEILPFIWVPNMAGSVSKIDTLTGNELARYATSPFYGTQSGSPSRTTVDLEGNCYVGNRMAGTVLKIGLFEMGNWIDRNGDGICQTSVDSNNDGDISPDEMLPWGDDECVLFEVVLIPGKEGTFVPGTFNSTYDRNGAGTAPRGLAVDSANNLWASSYQYKKFYYINGETGIIERIEPFTSLNHLSYGAVIDRYGKIWSSGAGTTTLMRMDPTTIPATFEILDFPYIVYGIGLDYEDHLFVTHYSSNRLSRVDINTMTIDWTIVNANLYGARGVVATTDNNIWVAESGSTKVVRFDNNGTQLNMYEVGHTPTGVSVDSEGKIWACNLNDNFISRIDPVTNTVDLKKMIINSMGHYSYSDMTGFVARTITTKTGTWTVIHDTMMMDAPWGKIIWTYEEPEGTELTVKVQSSNDLITWSEWETAMNGEMLLQTPPGRYLQIEATFKIFTGSESPILYDLTVEVGMLPMIIDIKPWNRYNVINPCSRGIIKVAILADENYDLGDIDLSQIYFGPNHAQPIKWKYMYNHHCYHHHRCNKFGSPTHLILYFRMEDTGIQYGDTSAELRAMLTGGMMLVGTDSIYTVPRHRYHYCHCR